MKILFAATDSIAVPLLEALSKEGLVRAVFTAPDAPGKRGKNLIPTPIKVKAMELGLPVYTPEHLRTEERALVKTLDTDTLLSFCYGRIFGPKFLALFERTFNVHPSPLPKYRGCSPIYTAIRNGEKESAISLQEIALGIDEGDLYGVYPFTMDGTETNESLETRVAEMAPSFVLGVLKDLENHPKKPQEGESSYTGFIGKEDGRLDFSLPARTLHQIIRACYPWPKAYALLGEEKLMLTGVFGSSFDETEACTEEPGTVVSLEKKKGLKIATGDGYLYVSKVLPPAKKEMDAASYVNGNRTIIGARLG